MTVWVCQMMIWLACILTAGVLMRALWNSGIRRSRPDWPELRTIDCANIFVLFVLLDAMAKLSQLLIDWIGELK